MYTIVNRATLTGLRDQVKTLQTSNADLARRAEQSRAAAQNALADASTERRMQDKERGWRREAVEKASRLSDDLAHANAELDILRAKQDEFRAVPDPEPVDPDQAVVVTVDHDAVRAYAEAGHAGPSAPWPDQADAWASCRKAEIASQLAPAAEAMRDAGLLAAGFRLALLADMQPWASCHMTDDAAEHRLVMARQHLIDTVGIGLLPLPDAAVVLPGHGWIPLLSTSAEPRPIDTWRADPPR
ncbi:MAG: hypothetical protein FWE35_01020 [Streptosporangiales bacterium]|nr:hypothetical protein [Streptosporangiales bacterium]